jgi:hypothetical protein
MTSAISNHAELDFVSMAPYNDNTDIDALLTGVQHAARTLR